MFSHFQPISGRCHIIPSAEASAFSTLDYPVTAHPAERRAGAGGAELGLGVAQSGENYCRRDALRWRRKNAWSWINNSTSHMAAAID
jgi:hypothetical protein